MMTIFNLIRWRALLFTAFYMYVIRYYVLKPALMYKGIDLQMPEWAFSLLVISVCCLVSAANIINDYFDSRADRISGVRKVVVGTVIRRRSAIALHAFLNFVAVSIAFYLGFYVGAWEIGLLFLLVSVLLWLYSSAYKKHFITGNLIVGFLSALVPISVMVFELPLLNTKYAGYLTGLEEHVFYAFYAFKWILAFSFFTFCNSVMYEVNKDIYSIDGDRENKINTIAVKAGIKSSRYVLVAGTLVCILAAALFYLNLFSDNRVILFYLVFALGVPYTVYLFSVITGCKKRKLQLNLIKLIMALCVGFAFLLPYYFRYLIEHGI